MIPWLALFACTTPEPEPEPEVRDRPRDSVLDERVAAPPDRPGTMTLRAVDALDGEIRDGTWHGDGADGVSRIDAGSAVVIGLPLPEALRDGSTPVEHARLWVQPVPHDVPGPVEISLRAVVRPPDPTRLPTERALSEAEVRWTLQTPGLDPYAGQPGEVAPDGVEVEDRDLRTPRECAPLPRATPDLAPLVREALAAGRDTLTLVLTRASGSGRLDLSDTRHVEHVECTGRLGPSLELATELRGLLVGRELLSRPTPTGATVTMWALEDLEVALDVGPSADALVQGPFTRFDAGTPISLTIDGLRPGTAGAYRTRIRRPGTEVVQAGPVHTVQTARPPGDPFTLTVTADTHFVKMERRRAWAWMQLLQTTGGNIAADAPDLHVDLGDTFSAESYRSYDAPDAEEALRRHLAVRPFFDGFAGDTSLFLALGNHEGELGWRIARGDPLPALATRARTALYPMPVPDGFYTGNPAVEPGLGPPQNYYAFEWGDTLIVVLDPYRYTTTRPHSHGFVEGAEDTWAWTLGEDQYRWLARTLEESERTFKLVFAHQVAGGTNTYGRGGRLAAVHAPRRDAPGSYEWGGENLDGSAGFAVHRPGWAEPIHPLLARTHVTAFVHGHDHVFVYEPPLAGVAYVAVPQPGNGRYEIGHYKRSGYHPKAPHVPSSGHVRLEVSPTEVTLSYVRAWLFDDGENREIAFQTTWTDCDRDGVPDSHGEGGEHHAEGCPPPPD